MMRSTSILHNIQHDPGVGQTERTVRACLERFLGAYHLDMKRLHPEVSGSTSLNPLFPANLLLRQEPEEEEEEDEEEYGNGEEDDDEDEGYSE
jgi:hypothetical protein